MLWILAEETQPFISLNKLLSLSCEVTRAATHRGSQGPPQGQGFFFFFSSRIDCTNSHSERGNPDCLPGLSRVHTVEFLNTHGVPIPSRPAPIHHHLSCRMSPQHLLIAAGKTTVSAADPALSTDQHFLYSTSQSPVNLSPVRRQPPGDAKRTWHRYPLAS